MSPCFLGKGLRAHIGALPVVRAQMAPSSPFIVSCKFNNLRRRVLGITPANICDDEAFQPTLVAA
jgi:hypothetical protein